MQKYIIYIVIVIVIGAGSFYGGMKYAQSKSGPGGNFANLTPAQRQARAQQFGGIGGGRGAGGGVSAGQVIAKDDKSITVKLRSGSTQIVFYTSSTSVGKAVDGVLSDIAVGQEITAIGTPNSDGSVSAQSIQIRPASNNATSTNSTNQ